MKLTLRIALFGTLLSLLPFSLFSQQDELGNWMMYFGTHKLSEKFSLHTEFQYRNHKIGPSVEQLLPRVGINYHFQPNAIVTAGYAFIPSYDFESDQKAPETTEQRIFQQLIINNKVGRAKIEHRYRVEQRWVNDDYRNRLRYRLMVAYPLNKSTFTTGTVFLAVYDEIFMNTKNTYFDRNRLYAAVGYQFSDSGNIQVGIMNQAVNTFDKYYLQFALAYNFDFSKKAE